jgi:hypothetical protein
MCNVSQQSPLTMSPMRRGWARPAMRGAAPAALAVATMAALSFDPHILLLSWSADRQETVPATSAATCREAIDAIRAGRWLAQDPPAAMACRQGSGFSERELCIERFNCRESGR